MNSLSKSRGSSDLFGFFCSSVGLQLQSRVLCGGGRPPSVAQPRTLHVTPRLETSYPRQKDEAREREREKRKEKKEKMAQGSHSKSPRTVRSTVPKQLWFITHKIGLFRHRILKCIAVYHVSTINFAKFGPKGTFLGTDVSLPKTDTPPRIMM